MSEEDRRLFEKIVAEPAGWQLANYPNVYMALARLGLFIHPLTAMATVQKICQMILELEQTKTTA